MGENRREGDRDGERVRVGRHVLTFNTMNEHAGIDTVVMVGKRKDCFCSSDQWIEQWIERRTKSGGRRV